MSALCYAGSAQLLALGHWGVPAPGGGGDRRGVHRQSAPGADGPGDRRPGSTGSAAGGCGRSLFVMADQNWALSVREMQARALGRRVPVRLGRVMWVRLGARTAAGHVLGSALRPPPGHPLFFAALAVFVSLLVLMWRGRRDLLPWAGGGRRRRCWSSRLLPARRGTSWAARWPAARVGVLRERRAVTLDPWVLLAAILAWRWRPMRRGPAATCCSGRSRRRPGGAGAAGLCPGHAVHQPTWRRRWPRAGGSNGSAPRRRSRSCWRHGSLAAAILGGTAGGLGGVGLCARRDSAHRDRRDPGAAPWPLLSRQLIVAAVPAAAAACASTAGARPATASCDRMRALRARRVRHPALWRRGVVVGPGGRALPPRPSSRSRRRAGVPPLRPACRRAMSSVVAPARVEPRDPGDPGELGASPHHPRASR